MKYVVFFFLVCVAIASAAPQLLSAWPGVGVAPIPLGRTVLAGNTLVSPLSGRLIAPGLVGAPGVVAPGLIGAGLIAPGLVGPTLI